MSRRTDVSASISSSRSRARSAASSASGARPRLRARARSRPRRGCRRRSGRGARARPRTRATAPAPPRAARRPRAPSSPRREEPARLQPVHGGEVVALDHRVEVLAADHAERRLRELARDVRRRVERASRNASATQRVPGEDADPSPNCSRRSAGRAAPRRRRAPAGRRGRARTCGRARPRAPPAAPARPARRAPRRPRARSPAGPACRRPRARSARTPPGRAAPARASSCSSRLLDERLQLLRTLRIAVLRRPLRALSARPRPAFASSESSPSSSIARSGEPPSLAQLLELGPRRLEPAPSSSSARVERLVSAHLRLPPPASLPRIPFTSLAASSDA